MLFSSVAIALDVPCLDGQGVMQTLAQRLSAITELKPNDIETALWQREKLGSTSLGFGIALPHGRIKNLKQTAAVLLRSQQGVAFNSVDGQSVTLFIALLVPSKAGQTHLDLLAQITETLADESVRHVLQNGDAAQIQAALAHLSAPN